MRFVVDECVGPTVARWLRDNGHDIVSVFEVARDSTDAEILAWAFREDRILITADNDFGDLIVPDRHPYRCVIMPSMDDETSENIIRILNDILSFTMKKSIDIALS